MDYDVTISTNQEFLDSIGKELSEVELICSSFSAFFGKKFLEIFSNEIGNNELKIILNAYEILKPLENCAGFNRHIKGYNKLEFRNHLFTARVANFLLKQGYDVELEPKMLTKSCPHPDIKFVNNQFEGFAECKRSKISKYFDIEMKRKIAELVLKYLPTSDQVDLYFYDEIDLSQIQMLISDKNLFIKMNSFFIPGKDGQENHIWISENFKIGIIQKPTIIGNPQGFPEITMSLFLENNDTNKRMIGNIFQLQGRSIGVYSLLDYSNKLRDKKEQSDKQIIKDTANVIFLSYSDIFGDPKDHKQYIESEWFKNKPDLSGVAFFESYFDGTETNDYFKYYENPNGKVKINFET